MIGKVKVTSKYGKELAKRMGWDMPPPKWKRAAKPAKVLRGEPHQMVWLKLPWPPGSNHAYPTAGNRRILSKEAKDYKQAVGFAVIEQDRGHVIGRLTVEIWCYPPNDKRFDLDGKLKLVLDALTDAGVWGDDGQIDHLTIHRSVPWIDSTDRQRKRIADCITVSITGEYPA